MTLSFQIIRSDRRKTAVLIVKPNQKVVVKAPKYFSEKEIKKFVNSHQSWIQKKIKQLKKLPRPIKKKFLTGEKFLLFGRFYLLQVEQSKLIKKLSLKFIQNRFRLIIPNNLKNREKILRNTFISWYLKNGLLALEKRADFWAKKLKVKFNKIKLKKVRSLWGSCSAKKNLSFNWKIVLAPWPVVDYVLLHELCHLIHRNHSPRFWQFLASFMPEYKQYKTWLRRNSHQLSV